MEQAIVGLSSQTSHKYSMFSDEAQGPRAYAAPQGNRL